MPKKKTTKLETKETVATSPFVSLPIEREVHKYVVKQAFKWQGQHYFVGDTVEGLPDDLVIKFCS